MVTARDAPASTNTPLAMLTVQFLAWLAARPRSYEDTMDAWRSSCPRLSVWEDALGAGLVALESADARGMRSARVVLTPQGWAALAVAENVTTLQAERRA